jgi:hypothetical protein
MEILVVVELGDIGTLILMKVQEQIVLLKLH